jgi:hypothetical protein
MILRQPVWQNDIVIGGIFMILRGERIPRVALCAFKIEHTVPVSNGTLLFIHYLNQYLSGA